MTTLTTGTDVDLELALPPPDTSLPQDREWCVVHWGGEWHRIYIHDYQALFGIPGLYERLLGDVLKCDSPTVVCSLLAERMQVAGDPATGLRVIDLGAGNGMVGEELRGAGASRVVGVDIIPEAADATERDRPGVYDDYQVTDMTRPDGESMESLQSEDFNAMTCVAALGFGDIPTAAFVNTFNLVRSGGWIAFNIKEDFLLREDSTGFARLIRDMEAGGALRTLERRRYRHRLATNGDPLHYVAVVGRKLRDHPVPDA